MEREVIKDLLSKYGLQPYDNIVDAYLKIVQIGFDSTWLRNVCIIKEFDKMYKEGMRVTDIYIELGITHKAHKDSIRRIVANRKEYEI